MNYDENLVYLAQDAGDPNYATDANFLAQLPFWIDAAENRIQRDLDLLYTYVEDDTAALSANRRLFTLPTDAGAYQVLVTVRIVTSDGTKLLAPISREAMDAFWPEDAAVGNPSIPRFWCPLNQLSIMVGPAPDQPYPVKLWGTQRTAPLAADNPETFISVYFPDLMHAAEMCLVLAWQRQFSGAAEEQAGALDWEREYQLLLKSSDVEESRKSLESSGWTTRQPVPNANPPLA